MARVVKILIVSVIVSLLLSGVFPGAASLYNGKHESRAIYNRLTSDKEIIVKYRNSDKADKVKADLKNKLNLSSVNTVKKLWVKNTELIEVDKNADIGLVLDKLRNDPYVEYACNNYFTPELSETAPNDMFFKDQWGHYNSGQAVADKFTGVQGIDANIMKAWDITKGNRDVVVGVLDTGIDINHHELKDNIFINPKEISNGIDDDGNGLIDDIYGWDFANDDNSVYDSTKDDYHGTGIAGIIAAKSNNELGISGVAPHVRIMPLKFRNGLAMSESRISDAVDAIGYAKSMGVSIINCSFTFLYTKTLEDAIRESDILFVCAAGNNSKNLDGYPLYPCCYDLPNVLSVASINNKGELSAFSNYGNRVHLAAPGENITHTLPEKSYGLGSGTSFAAPYVAGAAALIKSYKPDVSANEMASAIKSSVRQLDSLRGKTSTGGMLDASNAMKYFVFDIEKYGGLNVDFSGIVGENGWYRSDVKASIKFNNSREVGNISILYSFDNTNWNRYKNPVALPEGISTIYYCASDEKGNRSDSRNQAYKIDKSLPDVEIFSPDEGMSYILGSGITLNWQADDSISGINLVTGTVLNGGLIPTSKPGLNSLIITAEDKAGNVKTTKISYRVIYKYTGVSEPKAGKTYKCGSPLPVKFGLTDTKGSVVTNAKAKLYAAKITNGITGKESAVKSSVSSAGNSFKYDKTLKKYTFSLSTKGISPGTWRLRIALDDGTSKYVKVVLK